MDTTTLHPTDATDPTDTNDPTAATDPTAAADPAAAADPTRPMGPTHRVPPARATDAELLPAGQDGSLLAEYGLIAVVAAAIAGVLISWASGGAIADLFDALLSSARGLAGS